jgi:hypothetical protein
MEILINCPAGRTSYQTNEVGTREDEDMKRLGNSHWGIWKQMKWLWREESKRRGRMRRTGGRSLYNPAAKQKLTEGTTMGAGTKVFIAS